VNRVRATEEKTMFTCEGCGKKFRPAECAYHNCKGGEAAPLRKVEALIRKAGPCGEAGCTSVATCELKEALGWSQDQT